MSDPRKAIKQLEAEISRDLRTFNDELYHQVRATTPIRTGNARNGWTNVFRDFKKGSRKIIPLLENRVPYITALDEGWSRQAPQGIVEEAVKKTRKRR